MSDTIPDHIDWLHGDYLLLRDDYMAGKDTYQAMYAALAAYDAAIAAHVAAEVAAERPRCVVPKVVRDAARQKADDYDAYSHENIHPCTALLFQQRAEAVYTWLAALPPITPEEA
jgi:hypothetical protein